MSTLVGWSVEMKIEGYGREIWKMVDLVESERAAERSAAGWATRPGSLETRVLPYYRYDPTQPIQEPERVGMPTPVKAPRTKPNHHWTFSA